MSGRSSSAHGIVQLGPAAWWMETVAPGNNSMVPYSVVLASLGRRASIAGQLVAVVAAQVVVVARAAAAERAVVALQVVAVVARRATLAAADAAAT